MFPFFIKYKDKRSRTLQAPFNIAFSLGKNGVNDGIKSSPGITFRLRSNTTTNTKIDTAATKRNINLSVMINFLNMLT